MARVGRERRLLAPARPIHALLGRGLEPSGSAQVEVGQRSRARRSSPADRRTDRGRRRAPCATTSSAKRGHRARLEIGRRGDRRATVQAAQAEPPLARELDLLDLAQPDARRRRLELDARPHRTRSHRRDARSRSLARRSRAARARMQRSRVRAADGEAVDAERRETDADRDRLAVLAAGADALVELQVGADARDAGKDVGSVADQGGTLHRRVRRARPRSGTPRWPRRRTCRS